MIPFLDVLLFVLAFCSVGSVVAAITSERRRR